MPFAEEEQIVIKHYRQFYGWVYVKIFNHDVSGGLFTTNDDVGIKNPDDPDSKLFSILNQLESYRNSEGMFHFKLCMNRQNLGQCKGSTY